MDDSDRGSAPRDDALYGRFEKTSTGKGPRRPESARDPNDASTEVTSTRPGTRPSGHAPTQRADLPEADDGFPKIPGVVEMEILGRGGMGVVYKGQQAKLERLVAIKVLGDEYRSPQVEKRFLRECKHLARLDHNHVVRCYDSGVTANGEPYMVMEFVDGPNLAKWIGSHGPLSILDALRACRDLTEALEHGLDKKLIHRDVKPENVLLKPVQHPKSGAFPFQVKLADFGLSRSEREESDNVRVTQPGEAWGSPPTMAPEQFVMFGSVDFRADLYALGCILYFTLSGHHAFAQKTWDDLRDAKTKGPPPDLRTLRADVPEPVARLLLDMLQPDPKERPHSYEVLVRRIEEILTQLDPSLAGARPSSRINFGVLWILVGGALLSALVAWGVVHLASGGKPDVGRIVQPGGDDPGTHPDGPTIVLDPNAPTVTLPNGETSVNVGEKAILIARGKDKKTSLDHLVYEWKITKPANFAVELVGATLPTMSFIAPEPADDRDYDVEYEVIVKNEKSLSSQPARASVHVVASPRTKPLSAGEKRPLIKDDDTLSKYWTLSSGSPTAFRVSEDESLLGESSTRPAQLDCDLPRGTWKLTGKLRLDRGRGLPVVHGRVILQAKGTPDFVIELESSQQDLADRKTQLTLRGFEDRMPPERFADTDYVAFEATWDGDTLSLEHWRENTVGNQTSKRETSATANSGRMTSRLTTLSLVVEGDSTIFRGFVLTAR